MFNMLLIVTLIILSIVVYVTYKRQKNFEEYYYNSHAQDMKDTSDLRIQVSRLRKNCDLLEQKVNR